MLSVWWNIKGPIYWELLPRNSTITATTYCEEMARVASNLKGKQDKVFFLHDNAKAHISKFINENFLLQIFIYLDR